MNDHKRLSPCPVKRFILNRRVLIWTSVGLLIVAVSALPLYTCYRFVAWSTWKGSRKIEEGRYALLYETDHYAILNGAKEILANRLTYTPDPMWNPPSPEKPDPNDPNMPAAIKTLRPKTIALGPDHVTFEMGGGFFHYGLIAAPGDDFDPNRVPTGLVYVKLINGVWYYAEDNKLPARKP